ncbi:hypothetical protein [Hyphomicrobium sp.]|uniref:hypothetical protein n=1 Tax=Hyphomicrobium sp. TaxID=82 RepID=UPI001D490BF0|nr:hypothetical protein [Hyphomicrobium sp.]MBY0561626.1 hypothetical protein [Hyphomicrobium sp.]
MKSVQDAAIAKAIILSPDFNTYSMASRYRELAVRTKLDFSSAIRLLECLPVFIDGDVHQRIRKAMAKQISKTKDCQLTASREQLTILFERVFRKNTQLELVGEFSQPLWRSISASIVPPNGETLDLVDEIPALFSPILSIRERARISDRIRDYLSAHPEEGDDRLILLCLASLGARPFVGTLSLSLYEVFRENPKARMCDLAWPQLYPSSSLRFVDRICGKEADVAKSEFRPGERVRCFTQSADYSDEDNARALFGYGAHTCLGKSISEKVWGLVVETFSRSDLKAEPLTITMSPHNDPFLMPAQIQIGLT